MPRLRAALVVVTSLATVVATGAAAQGPGSARQAKASYTAPAGSQYGATLTVGGQGSSPGTAMLPVRRGEALVTLRVVDDSGRAVAAEVVQLLDQQTGAYVQLGEVCGSASQTFRLQRAGAPVAVRPLLGTCAGGPSAPTTGTVEALFRAQ